VRFLGNVSTGRMAAALARAALRRGDRVTLFLAEHAPAPRSRRTRLRRFVTSGDLRARLQETRPAPDVVLHAAAVSDYAPAPVRGKVASGRPAWTLRLLPRPKLVAELRRRHPRAILCMFKLESGVSRAELVRRATAAARRAGADLVFANRLEDVGREHRGLLIDPGRGGVTEARTRAAAARVILAACAAAAGRGQSAAGAVR